MAISGGLGLRLAGAVILAAGMLTTSGFTSAASPAPDCQPVAVPVSLVAGAAASATISGTLCLPSGPAPTTVQLLVSGATYDQSYWDFPYQPERYSYVRSALAAGFATLAIDPLGTGDSTHPLSAAVTMQTSAYTVHQVVGAARGGGFGPAFGRVMLASHSMGTAVAWAEVGTYHDVDGLIATGNVHVPSAVVAAKAVAGLYPAFLDPAFSAAGLDPGYVTTRPGTRAGDFYNTADADPAVIAEDERLKQPVTATFLATYFGEDIDFDSARITVPVLLATGQQDSLMCGLAGTDCSTASSLLAAEAPFYSAQTCLQAYVLPGAGHDMNLSLNAPSFFAVAQQWAQRWIGASGPQPARHCVGPAGPAG